MSAIEQAEADMARGDFGRAKERLVSRLMTTGYDAPLLSRIARICHGMKDPVEAGRYWLASDDVGPEVDAAVSMFVERFGPGAREVAMRLPRQTRLASIEDYPETAQERIRRHGLQHEVLKPREVVTPPADDDWSTLFTVGCVGTGVLLLVSIAVGLATIVQWIVQLIW